MLSHFGPTKWKVVQWAAYVTSIWTVQMDDGPMDSVCYVNLDRPNRQQSDGPPMLRQFGPFKWTMVQWTVYVPSIWTVQMDHGQMDRPCNVNLDRPNGRRSIGPSSIWTVQIYVT